MTDLKVKKADIFRVPPELILERDGFNLRDYNTDVVSANIASLEQAILNGLTIPPLLAVRSERKIEVGGVLHDAFDVIEGHQRRLAANRVKDAYLKKYGQPLLLDVRVLPKTTSEAELTALMIRSGDQGLKLSVLEVANGVKRLADEGQTADQIAVLLGRTRARVDQLLILGNADTEIKSLVSAGRISADTAIKFIQAHGDKALAFIKAEVERAEKAGVKVGRDAASKKEPQSESSFIPKKYFSASFECSSKLVNAIPASVRETLLDESKQVGADEVVSLPASVLRDLLLQHSEAEAARLARIERAEKRTAKQQAAEKGASGGEVQLSLLSEQA